MPRVRGAYKGQNIISNSNLDPTEKLSPWPSSRKRRRGRRFASRTRIKGRIVNVMATTAEGGGPLAGARPTRRMKTMKGEERARRRGLRARNEGRAAAGVAAGAEGNGLEAGAKKGSASPGAGVGPEAGNKNAVAGDDGGAEVEVTKGNL